MYIVLSRLLLPLLIFGWSRALRNCKSDELCVTRELCEKSDDTGRGHLVPRLLDSSCSPGFVCCDKEQLRIYNSSQEYNMRNGEFKTAVPDHPHQSCGSPGGENECVPRHLCNGTINDNGRYLISARIDQKNNFGCKSLEYCCPINDQLNEKDSEPMRNLRDFKYKGCGYSNRNGLYFDIVGYNDNEALFGEFPWMIALLDMHGAYVCGGTLIHPSLVLTSAHNVVPHSAKSLVARAGEWDLKSVEEPHPYQTRQIRRIERHDQFNTLTLYNDIALLVLEQPFLLEPHIQPLCLPPVETPKLLEQLRSAQCFATGWGHLNITSDPMEHILKRIDLPVLDHQQCQQMLRQTILGHRFILRPSFLCAGGEKGKDTCKGDGGSPLFCTMPNELDRYVLAGIVSWGIECAVEKIPATYTNVPHLRTWIDEKALQNGFQLS